jgi:hypothetical protein
VTPLLDSLARTVAAAPAGSDAEDRFARDALLRRGFAGALALSALGHLVKSPTATAATCPSGSLDNCVSAAYRNFTVLLAASCDKESSFAAKFGCLREAVDYRRQLQRTCERRCPKPKPKRPSKSKPGKTRKPPPPPPLPPNPYDDGGLCAVCMGHSQGACCYGGQLPGGYCNCAPVYEGKQVVECSALGCGG